MRFTEQGVAIFVRFTKYLTSMVFRKPSTPMYLKFEGSLDREKACNRLAGAFLMPKEMFLREVGTHRSSIAVRELFQLKKRFGASAQAIVYARAIRAVVPPSIVRGRDLRK